MQPTKSIQTELFDRGPPTARRRPTAKRAKHASLELTDRLLEPGMPDPCSRCPWSNRCGAIGTMFQCSSRWPSPRAGPHELHPDHVESPERYAEFGGFEFTATAPFAQSPHLRAGLIPRISLRRPFPTLSHFDVVAIGIDEIRLGSGVVHAEEIRRKANLDTSTQILIEWFVNDNALEIIDVQAIALVESIQSGGFMGVTSPSYSTYRNLAYFHARYGMVRSLSAWQDLAIAGLAPIPHFGPVCLADTHDYIQWLQANPNVSCIAFDLSCEMKANQQFSLNAMRLIDAGTNFSLHFLIHGAASETHFHSLMSAVDPSRLSITNGRAAFGWEAGSADRSDSLARTLAQQQASYSRALERCLSQNAMPAEALRAA